MGVWDPIVKIWVDGGLTESWLQSRLTLLVAEFDLWLAPVCPKQSCKKHFKNTLQFAGKPFYILKHKTGRAYTLKCKDLSVQSRPAFRGQGISSLQ